MGQCQSETKVYQQKGMEQSATTHTMESSESSTEQQEPTDALRNSTYDDRIKSIFMSNGATPVRKSMQTNVYSYGEVHPPKAY